MTIKEGFSKKKCLDFREFGIWGDSLKHVKYDRFIYYVNTLKFRRHRYNNLLTLLLVDRSDTMNFFVHNYIFLKIT